ncbi:CTP synthase (glutamine hydrolyzing), partial [Candidatus Woesearchaeota archaeon]|nr:CTP synthase (glutamine hydrolyzing) [Candidatus Woesearchaeota archaeon]
MKKDVKWIIVTGGVLSGIGKGTAAASIGKLLSLNFKVVPIKCDGYINVDPGTMNPFEHGEVFVLDDGGEVDMDFGHYERMLDINATSEQSITTGKVFGGVIRKEREGKFLGKTVQVIPHITNDILERFERVAEEQQADVILVEIGGTAGDIENSWFIEAARQLKHKVGEGNICYVHLSYVPFLDSVGQQKTKPVQRDVQHLRENGIIPDIIIARSRNQLHKESKEKIALFCDVPLEAVISARDIESVYQVPAIFEKEGLLDFLARKFSFKPKTDLAEWNRLVNRILKPAKEVNIVIGGKYTMLNDSYASLIEALIHAGAHFNAKVNIRFIETTDIETGKVTVREATKGADGIIIPIGFGSRGVEGKIACAQYARENNIPYLGLCYGMQLAVVEFARNVCGLKDAHTTECEPKTPHPVIDILPEQRNITDKGGTMRLGLYEAVLKPDTIVQKLYGKGKVAERHRHRYEVNPEYHEILQKHGLVLSGTSENGRLV